MTDTPDDPKSRFVGRHLQVAWWSLLCFVTLGITLEAMHGLKIAWYLAEPYEVRRLMWTLAHTHGTLLALVHAAFAFTIHVLPEVSTGRRGLVSPLLIAASVLMPGGFFLGGLFIYAGDPGLGIWLVPLGAAALFASIFLIATGLVRGRSAVSATRSS